MDLETLSLPPVLTRGAEEFLADDGASSSSGDENFSDEDVLAVVTASRINKQRRRRRHPGRGRHHPHPPPVKRPRQASWAIDNLKIRDLWKEGCDGAGSKVCVLDTGINTRHAEIKIAGSANFSTSRSVFDRDGHGTHCAGTSTGHNVHADIGVAPKAELYVGKVFGDTGNTSLKALTNGIAWATRHKVDVISMSLGGDGDIPLNFASAISNAIKNNVIVVVAAGNSGPYRNTVEEPGNFTPCVTVGAVASNRRIAKFSSRGSQVDIVAPGVDILSSFKGSSGSYAKLSGTSMATPFVAGVAALFVQKARAVGMKYNQSIFERLVKETATDLGPVGFDPDYGAGLVNPKGLIAIVETIAKPAPTKEPKI